MKSLRFLAITAFFVATFPCISWAQSATISEVAASPTFPPSITIKAAPAQGYTHVEIQLLRNGYWTTLSSQQGQSVVNAVIKTGGAYKVRARGKNINPAVLGDWIEHAEGYRFTIAAGEVTPPPAGPLCVSKTQTTKIQINLGWTCNTGSCGESFGRACYSAGGYTSGSGCYKNQTTVLTCT